MNNIEWKDGAVCYANGKQFFMASNGLLFDFNQVKAMRQVKAIEREDFQLNEIRTGDYIEASELDTEQKYNDVVDVFGLFGFKFPCNAEEQYKNLDNDRLIYVNNGWLLMAFTGTNSELKKRKLTYSQVIAIGKLKRLMSAPKTSADKFTDGQIIKPYNQEYIKSYVDNMRDKNTDQVKNPKHYQLIEGVESIEVIARSMTKEQWKGFCLGNMLKYRIRAGKKDALQQDIDKANFYGELYEMHKDKCYE